MKNNNICFETPINSKITDSFLINLTRASGKKTREVTLHPLGNCLLLDTHSPPLKISVALSGAYGYFLELHKKEDHETKTKSKTATHQM